ncbi:exonuclease domain-containing protein [Psychroflexus aestuariivivens]|uniref:exonuclease domain-containing protein n=1 Tax=Psychroflexus aestuariivivens TaxID=1795040 RepID=UPI000FDB2C3B|nr:exonuclease domain-containing protein [Psychroflexus aestuariivivens]
MYAILDIESTGGKFNEEGITEIAIYKFDGEKIVDEFVSLINPERRIQSFVVGLTGINNEMVHTAPKFYEVAKRIVEITEDCTIVAHNAKFDYRMLRLEFNRLGFEFERNTLCTVKLSKVLLPGHNSYSLGKLVKSLGISIKNRHRASGDALATVELFEMLLAKDPDKAILEKNLNKKIYQKLDKDLLDLVKTLPESVGVYYFLNKSKEVIYVGKSKNLKKRSQQHFTSDNHKSKQIQSEVEKVEFEITGNELQALLKENQAIKRLQPKYNRALVKNIFSYALYVFKDDLGYLNLSLSKVKPNVRYITSFTNYQQGKSFMERMLEQYELCQKLTGLHQTKGACFNYTIKQCNGACVTEESAEIYNERVQKLIDYYDFEHKNMVIQDRGRHSAEKSLIIIEDGQLCAIGFVNADTEISNINKLKTMLNSIENDRDAQHIIQSYLRKRNKNLKIHRL